MLRILVGLGRTPARGQAVCVHSLQQLSGDVCSLTEATLVLSPWACLAHRELTSAHMQADVLRGPAIHTFPEANL